MRVVVEASLIDVGDIQDGLRRNQVQIPEDLAFVLIEVERTNGVAFVEVFLDLLYRVANVDVFLARGLGVFLGFEELLLHRLEIGERQFGVDRLDIVDWIDRARHMRDIVVFETTHDVCDRIGLSNIGKELVAEALAL